MSEKINNADFIRTILTSLTAMEDVNCIAIDDTMSGLYKSNVLFGLVIDAEIYLRSKDRGSSAHIFKGKKYNKTTVPTSNNDVFLLAATKAYWVASAKL
jgi:hypothetical protein